jgi:hypothetical protein
LTPVSAGARRRVLAMLPATTGIRSSRVWASVRAAGARAVVTEVTAGARALLVGLEVSGTPVGGVAERWQVLTLKGDRIADICGFDDRAAAAVRAGVPV